MNYIDPLAKVMGGMVVERHGLFHIAQSRSAAVVCVLRGKRTLDERSHCRT